MIGFTGRETLLSVLYALIYGIGFSLIYRLIALLCEAAKSIPYLLKAIIGFKKIFPPPSIKDYIKGRKNGGVFAFFSVFLFFAGFLLLSYFSLDGQLRIYMFILSSASFYICNSTFSVILEKLCVLIFDGLLLALSTTLRLLILPVRSVVLSLKGRKKRNI